MDDNLQALRQKLIRNQFPTDGKYEIPVVYPSNVDLKDCELVGYSSLSKDDKNCKKTGIHFFIEDWRFDPIVRNPLKYVERFRKYRFITSLDISLWSDMNTAQLIGNLHARRWLDAVFQAAGINVIPAAGWANEESFDFCFDGLPENSIIAVSTNGAYENKDGFMKGFIELCKRKHPKVILCYCTPFREMYNYAKIVVFPHDIRRRQKNSKTLQKRKGRVFEGYEFDSFRKGA